MTDFRASFDKMAQIMAQKATLETTPFAEITEAFKVMTAYYALTLKHKTNAEDEDNGFNFGSGIEHEEGNGSSIPGRRDS